MADFPDPRDLLAEVGHRPWPMPNAPWIMTQSWHDLLFAHWPVDPRGLRENVPTQLELDLYEGQAWIAVVPFRMTNVAPRFVPAIPMVSNIIELNVRTYVVVGGKPGVYFFSLDANRWLAVAAARMLFGLPYFVADMSSVDDRGEVTYRSLRFGKQRAEWRGRYRPIGATRLSRPGTLEHFLVERYCLYTVDRGRVYRVEIHHPPWPLQDASAAIEMNTMVDAAGVRLPSIPPLLHFAKRQDVLAWPIECVR